MKILLYLVPVMLIGGLCLYLALNEGKSVYWIMLGKALGFGVLMVVVKAALDRRDDDNA